MTKAILALLVFYGLTGIARGEDICPNLSGEFVYQGEDGLVRWSIVQTRCEQIRIDRITNYLGKITTEQHTLKLDGKFQNDTGWLGSPGRYQTSAKFTSAALEIIVRSPGGNDSDFSSKFLYVLRSSGDLDIRRFDRQTDAYLPDLIAVRQ